MFEKVMKVYAVNATVLIHDKPTHKISIDTNAGTATQRIQESYDFKQGGYNLDKDIIFTNGHHYIAYETYPYPGSVHDSILILTSRCSDRNLDEEKSKIWVCKGIQEARKKADKIFNK